MPAVPIYVWNGSAWQETGPTIPASPIKYQASAPSSPSTGDIWVDSDGDVTTGSQQFQRFRFVASGGETTISGADANGAVLAYTAGLEQVVLNGAVLVRGHDYTATNGTTISGLSPALVANDVLEVFSFIAFTVANTYTQSQVDGLLDSYVGLRLITPTSVVGGTITSTGAVNFTSASSVSLNNVFTSAYQNYKIVINAKHASDADLTFRLRSGTDLSSNNYYQGRYYVGETSSLAAGNGNASLQTSWDLGRVGTWAASMIMDICNPQTTEVTSAFTSSSAAYFQVFGQMLNNITTSYDGFTILSGGSMTGTVRVYGYKN